MMADMNAMDGQAAAEALMRTVRQAQRVAFQSDFPVSEALRRDRLERVLALLKKHADGFCRTLSEDFGHRSEAQSMMTDIIPSLRQAKHALKHLRRWMKPERRALDLPLRLLGGKASVVHQPLGVIGIIAPWNFPVQLTFGPLIGALAAGNRAMIKSSEFTPATARLIEQAIAEYFSPEEVYACSGGTDVAQAFARLPFDHMIFTGATGIGRHILHAAADNLTPVTLELGGKSPTIIGRSANLTRAAERIAIGKMMNAGQICLAPDYILAPRETEGALVREIVRAASSFYPTLLDNDDYTNVVNGRHHERLKRYIADAVAKGARLTVVNPADEDYRNSDSHKLPLHILQDVTDEMQVMQEEIFGPILPIVAYERTADAVAYVNARERPLGLYYFGEDKREERQILSRTISGGATINDVLWHVSVEDLPFGGVGASGMGAYHGRDGFRTFSHARSVYRQPRIDIAKLAGLKPPYGSAARKMIQRELGRRS